jgi:hypothetical protein
MINLPNPFDSALAPAMGADTAAAPHLTDPAVAAADYLPSVTPARAPTTAAAGANAAAAFLDDDRFKLDVDAFMAAIEEAPSFLSAPRPEYLRAAEIEPVLTLLAGY